VFPNPLTTLLDRLIVCDNNDCMSTLWFPQPRLIIPTAML